MTGEQDGYRVPNPSAGTRTDTPLRDIPQSIQVIPQQVLKDQQANNVNEALRNITGLTQGQQSDRTSFEFTARGFSSNTSLRNGLPDPLGSSTIELSNVERIEFLSSPASVLFGQGGAGGTINFVTKQPLRDPFYAIEATVGSYDFYRGAVDLSGPLNDEKTVSYRLNTSYLDKNGFTDFFNEKVFLIAPVIRWDVSKKTSLTLEADYTEAKNLPLYGLPAIGTVLPNPNGQIPPKRNISEPDGYQQVKTTRVGYRLEHQFSDNWSFRNSFQAVFSRDDSGGVSAAGLESDDRTLDRGYGFLKNYVNNYNLTTDIIGKFSTGSIKHQLLFGVDLSRSDVIELSSSAYGTAPSLDLFNPVYSQPLGPSKGKYSFPSVTDTLGVYVQDQVTLADNLKLLLGGRFDTLTSKNRDELANTESSQSSDAFSPRFGIVYQPLPPISLYASYSRSFSPASGTDFEGNLFQPERGNQYEVGVKADLNDRLSVTLAFYELTRTNISTDDTRPGVPQGNLIQIGEQRSRGIELNMAGEILPGWNIYAGYAYTDARITEDNTFLMGNQLYNTPENAFKLWTSYEIQKGFLQGLGFGVGFFFVGDR
ncbi:TonB-dependent siderophore receptor [Nostoc sp.]|uniref:TonB-dependent siderophore receptor n=1 Tax=Nostoc sp. TaxID=1180 RepID=UPI002FF479B1